MRENQTKPSNNRWLVIVAGVAVVLLGIILQWTVAARQDTSERRRFGEENLGKLKPGMTLNEMEEILGPSRTASAIYDRRPNSCHQRAWNKAVEQGKVQEWDRFGYRIQVAFPGNPAGDSNVVVIKIERPAIPGFEQRPRDKWMATKESFLKLKVGMTLPELEDIIGVGEPARGIENVLEGAGWESAAKEYRVYRWATRGSEYPPIPTCPVIVAAFAASPSAAPEAKSLAVSFRDGGGWDEDKGTLAGAQAGRGH